MDRFEYNVPMDFDIVDIGDTHIGDMLCHEKGIDKIVDYVLAEPYRYWLHKGDWIEAITTDDKRFNLSTAKQPLMTPQQEAEYAIAKFKPIAERGIIGLFGNHEAKLHRIANFAETICKGLNIRYGTYSSRIIFRNKDKELFKMFITHGRWPFNSNAKDYEQRLANRKASLKMHLKFKIGDCAIMSCGHAHQLMVVPPTQQLYLYDGAQGIQAGYLKGKQTGNFIDPDHRWYGCSGSTLRLYQDGLTGYAEQGGYDPVEMGFLSWEIRDGIITDCKKIVL